MNKQDKIGREKVSVVTITEAHKQMLLKDMPEVSMATLLAGECAVVTIQSIENIVAELSEFIGSSGISKNHRLIFKGLLAHFLNEKAKQDGVIFIEHPWHKK